MSVLDKAHKLGVEAAKKAMSLEKALKKRCPFQSAKARDAFIAGWRSVLDPVETKEGSGGD